MKEHSKGMYKNEVEMPELAPMGHMEHGYGCMSFKGEADPIAYGQSAKEGCKMDDRRLAEQSKDYHWD